MSLFTVDQEKCKRDGICVDVCPMSIIQIKDENQVPTPVERAEELCIDCGHCVAVCPHGAISTKRMKPEQCPPLKVDLLPGAEQVEHLMRARRSIRTFKDTPVDRSLLAKLIDVARYAPTGGNLQPVKWLVVYDAGDVHKLAGMVVDFVRSMVENNLQFPDIEKLERLVAGWDAGVDVVCRDAPHVIIAYVPMDDRPASLDCTIALTYLELAAPSFGLGACWAGFVNAAATFWPPIKEFLGLPEGLSCIGAMMVGYPKYKYHRLPLRKEAKIDWL